MDHRIAALNASRWYESFNERTMRAVVAEHLVLSLIEDEELDEDFEVLLVRFTFEACPTCRGTGTHVNPSIDCNGLTYEDFDRDPDFEENYFNGCFDVQCYECKGKRVVPIIDPSDANAPLVIGAAQDFADDEAYYAAECAAERRMGY